MVLIYWEVLLLIRKSHDRLAPILCLKVSQIKDMRKSRAQILSSRIFEIMRCPESYTSEKLGWFFLPKEHFLPYQAGWVTLVDCMPIQSTNPSPRSDPVLPWNYHNPIALPVIDVNIQVLSIIEMVSQWNAALGKDQKLNWYLGLNCFDLMDESSSTNCIFWIHQMHVSLETWSLCGSEFEMGWIRPKLQQCVVVNWAV